MSDLKLWLRDGIWQVSGTVKIPGRKKGVRVRESSGTSRLRDAEAYRDKTRQEVIDREIHGPAFSLTFADCCALYLEKGGEKRFIKPIFEKFENVRIRDLTADKISAFAMEKYGHLAPASIKRFFYTPLNAAIAKGCKAHNIAPVKFEAPKVERATIIAAPAGWFPEFFQAAHFRIAVMVLFLTTTGRRVTEACRVKLEDCRFDHPRGPRVLISRTKSGKPILVPLAPVLAKAMQRLIAADDITKPESFVFGYASRWSVNQAIERVCTTAGIKYYSSHKLGRHAFATRFLDEGGSLKLLKDAGGWAGIQIVDDSYGYLEANATDQDVLDMASVITAHIDDTRLTHTKNGHQRKNKENPKKSRKSASGVVGTRGIEPLTPTMSREVSTPEEAKLLPSEIQENKAESTDHPEENHVRIYGEPARNLQETKSKV